MVVDAAEAVAEVKSVAEEEAVLVVVEEEAVVGVQHRPLIPTVQQSAEEK